MKESMQTEMDEIVEELQLVKEAEQLYLRIVENLANHNPKTAVLFMASIEAKIKHTFDKFNDTKVIQTARMMAEVATSKDDVTGMCESCEMFSDCWINPDSEEVKS